jgi:hypothetical protein
VDDTGYEEPWTYYLPSLLPRNKVKLLARYMVWQDGWFQLTSQYVDERKAQQDEDLDEYITVDAGFEQGFKYDGMKYTAKAFVGNVTGTTYEEVSGYEMPKYVWGFQVGCKF